LEARTIFGNVGRKPEWAKREFIDDCKCVFYKLVRLLWIGPRGKKGMKCWVSDAQEKFMLSI
jgi:hypothetical protein